MAIRHPAKYTDALLLTFAKLLAGYQRILDPFAGTGKIFKLKTWLPEAEIIAYEIEPEWAALHPLTQVGNALDLPLPDNYVDALCTSPTYGNRLSDHHKAKDNSVRRSYTHDFMHDFGRSLNPVNSGTLQWGDKYRDFHKLAWQESRRVLKPGGLFVLNIKNHIRNGKEQYVSEWHVEYLCTLGFVIQEWLKIGAPCLRYGQNSNSRIDHENVIALRLDVAGK